MLKYFYQIWNRMEITPATKTSINSGKGEEYFTPQENPYGCLYLSLSCLLQDKRIAEENNLKDKSHEHAEIELIQRGWYPRTVHATDLQDKSPPDDRIWNSIRNHMENTITGGDITYGLFWGAIADEPFTDADFHAIGIKPRAYWRQSDTEDKEEIKVFDLIIIDTRRNKPFITDLKSFLNGPYSDLVYLVELMSLEKKTSRAIIHEES